VAASKYEVTEAQNVEDKSKMESNQSGLVESIGSNACGWTEGPLQDMVTEQRGSKRQGREQKMLQDTA